MESVAQLNARGQRYNEISGTLYLIGFIGLIILIVYAIYQEQLFLVAGIIAVALLFLGSVLFEVRGDAAFDEADALGHIHNPTEPLKGVRQ